METTNGVKNLGIYCRVSSKKQMDGTSLENQKERGIKWCKNNGYNFEIYSDEVFGKTLLEYFDQGNEFLNWSDIKKRCRELQIEEFSQHAHKKALEKKSKEYEQDRPTGLGNYLKTQGWNSLEEAIFYTSKRLYKMGQLYKPTQEAFAKYADLDFNEATEQGWKLGLVNSIT